MKPSKYCVLLSLLACGQPRPPPPPVPCDTACQLEQDRKEVRIGNPDYLVEAPGIWRFYDDFSARLRRVPECGTGPENFGGLKPLWRRTLISGWGSSAFGSRNPISVASGTLAVNLDGVMSILDARTGAYRHAFENAYAPVLPGELPEDLSWIKFYSFRFGYDFAALTPDGKKLWFNFNDGPALLDLENVNRKLGIRKVFLWDEAAPSAKSGAWRLETPALGPDGTLFWNGPDGVRATETTGRTRWLHQSGGGFAFADEEGTSYWSKGNGPIALRAHDGSFKWQAPMPSEYGFGDGYAIEVERPGKRRYLTYGWSNRFITAHSLVDGSLLWFRDMSAVLTFRISGLQAQGEPRATQAPDGTLYLATTTSWLGGPGPFTGFVHSLDGSTGEPRWTTSLPMAEGLLGTEERLPSSEVRGGPVASQSKQGGVYVASANCKLYDLDRDGKIRRWYQLGGIPSDDTPQFVDGILYVVVRVSNPARLIDDGKSLNLCVHDDPKLEEERYECPEVKYGLCMHCVNRDIIWIYAFKVE